MSHIRDAEPNSLHRVSPNVWWFAPDSSTDRPSLAAVVCDGTVLFLDLGASPRHLRRFRDALGHRADAAPKLSVVSHWHWDHVFGMQQSQEPIIATRATAAELDRIASYDFSDEGLATLVADGRELQFCADMMKAELADSERAALGIRRPDIVFDSQIAINAGVTVTTLVHVGGDHAADSLIAHVAPDGVLFLGDCLYGDIYGPHYRYTRPRVQQVIDTIRSLEFDIVIEGHSNDVWTAEQLRSRIDAIEAAFDAVDRQPHASTQEIVSLVACNDPSVDVPEIIEMVTAGKTTA